MARAVLVRLTSPLAVLSHECHVISSSAQWWGWLCVLRLLESLDVSPVNAVQDSAVSAKRKKRFGRLKRSVSADNT